MAIANVERGEVELEVNGKAYVLRLSTNSAAAWEKSHGGRKVGDLLASAASLSFIDIRDFVWLLLQKYHKDEFAKIESVGDLIDDAGGVGKFFAAIDELIKANQPNAGTAEADKAAAENPTPAQIGVGAAS